MKVHLSGSPDSREQGLRVEVEELVLEYVLILEYDKRCDNGDPSSHQHRNLIQILAMPHAQRPTFQFSPLYLFERLTFLCLSAGRRPYRMFHTTPAYH